MSNAKPTFQLSPGSPRAAGIEAVWSLLPLKIPTGWAIRSNTIIARKLPSGEVQTNDSEDLFWAVKLPSPSTHVYSTDPASQWREIHVDAGWYRDHFRIVVLDPDWDHVRHTFSTASLEEFLHRLEAWLLEIANDGDVRNLT
ncbi:hypothetical protein [Polyangium sp. y55x31]|uniref:hypothetical protein n=1 Tax=Polyangium sp. y55x31 TaxID=3042688 RepID=UPI002482350B|nr:hypothetical protein [Polyangium sp. y55x31]MDI1482713.1 hypothetical protein [Polyangium sp. y55x31]